MTAGYLGSFGLAVNDFVLQPLYPPAGPINLQEVRIYVSALLKGADDPIFECALYNYYRPAGSFNQIPGSYAKWVIIAAGALSKKIETTVRPAQEPVFFGSRFSHGVSMSADCTLTNRGLARARVLSTTENFPRTILNAAIPLDTTNTVVPNAVYLSNRMIDVL